MDDNITRLSSFNAAYAVAEDIYRLDPWDSDIAPFMLMDPAHPDAYVYVVFDYGEGDERRIRLILGLEGLRAYMAEEDLEIDFPEEFGFSAERFVNGYDGYYLEVRYNTELLNSYERNLNANNDRIITLRRQRPGFAMASIADVRDIDHIGRYLTSIRKLLTKQLATTFSKEETQQKHMSKFVFDAPLWLDNGITLEASERFTLTKNQWLTPGEGLIDEFTNARMRHMPKSPNMYELYFFYLTVSPYRGAFPVSFFLVNLETGLLEWSDVLECNPGWHEQLIRNIYAFFTKEGARPTTIMVAHASLYARLKTDLQTAKIDLEFINRSYVADELMEGYLRAARIKKQTLLAESAPESPEL